MVAIMTVDSYGLLAAAVMVSIALVQNVLMHLNLAKTYEERSKKAMQAGKSAPNDALIKLAMLPGLVLFAYVGYFHVGPLLAKAMGAH
jgi:divalent metal cation (Fe/Co/Zn/Cd) transporter